MNALAQPETAAGSSSRNLCWNCRQELGQAVQCDHCVKIQPLGRGSDYFSVMGLQRKLQIDPALLESLFHALSRRFHPDVYRLASPRERMIALENSAVLNQAYRTLRDPYGRAHYLLQLERGRADDLKPSAPADLFEEILELQEQMAEYRTAEPTESGLLLESLRARRAELADRRTALEERLTHDYFPLWDGAATGTPERTRAIEGIDSVLSERAYLNRVLAGIDRLVGDAEPGDGTP